MSNGDAHLVVLFICFIRVVSNGSSSLNLLNPMYLGCMIGFKAT